MAAQAEAWFRELYLSKVIYKYTNKGFLLKQHITPPAEMDGKKLYFPVALPGTASETRRGDKVKTMNSGRQLVEITANWYEAAEKIFKMDIHKMSPNEMEVATWDAAQALGKKHDQVIIGKVHAGAGTYGDVVGDFNTGWDLQKAMTAVDLLYDKTENPDDHAVCVIPTRAFAQMMAFEAFSSSDYVGDYPLAKGVKAKTWFKCHWIEGYRGLFPLSGTDQTFYAWFPKSIGSGDSGGVKSDINYLPEERAWLADNLMEIGTTVLLPEGIQECKMKSTSLIQLS